MEIRELRYFAAVAAEGHFGRAAKALYVSQPSLSYAVKAVEARLGIQLFHRHSRGVDLTEAGAELLAVANQVLRTVDSIDELAERHRQGTSGRLRIGWQGPGAGRLSTRARQEFTALFPNVRIETHTYNWQQEITALRNGEVDVAFVWLPADVTGLHIEVVAEEPRLCAMSAGHRLRDRTELSILDLNDEPCMSGASTTQSWIDWWVVNPRPDGSPVKFWGRSAKNTEELLELVSEGGCIGTVAASVATYYPRPDIRFVPITDIEPLRIAIAWVEGNASPVVEQFAAIVRRLAHGEAPGAVAS